LWWLQATSREAEPIGALQMNLLSTIEQIVAGGPGSGCHGDKCGRPRGSQSFKTSGGATYTILAPSRKNIPKAKHTYHAKMIGALKGQYKVATVDLGKGKTMELQDVKGRTKAGENSRRVSSVYDAKVTGWLAKNYGTTDKYEGHGQTVIVHRDYDKGRVVVQVIPHDEFNKTALMEVYKFKNFGTAAGFLNSRFGIKQKLPKPGSLDAAKEKPRASWIKDLVENYDPEQIEELFSKVFSEQGQPFEILSADKNSIWVELKDGKKVQVVL
jgi:hypothetical protein